MYLMDGFGLLARKHLGLGCIDPGKALIMLGFVVSCFVLFSVYNVSTAYVFQCLSHVVSGPDADSGYR